jgi:hypothetical protein
MKLQDLVGKVLMFFNPEEENCAIVGKIIDIYKDNILFLRAIPFNDDLKSINISYFVDFEMISQNPHNVQIFDSEADFIKMDKIINEIEKDKDSVLKFPKKNKDSLKNVKNIEDDDG